MTARAFAFVYAHRWLAALAALAVDACEAGKPKPRSRPWLPGW